MYVEHLATLPELDSGAYSIDDIADANEALDAWQDAQAIANKPKDER